MRAFSHILKEVQFVSNFLKENPYEAVAIKPDGVLVSGLLLNAATNGCFKRLPYSNAPKGKENAKLPYGPWEIKRYSDIKGHHKTVLIPFAANSAVLPELVSDIFEKYKNVVKIIITGQNIGGDSVNWLRETGVKQNEKIDFLPAKVELPDYIVSDEKLHAAFRKVQVLNTKRNQHNNYENQFADPTVIVVDLGNVNAAALMKILIKMTKSLRSHGSTDRFTKEEGILEKTVQINREKEKMTGAKFKNLMCISSGKDVIVGRPDAFTPRKNGLPPIAIYNTNSRRSTNECKFKNGKDNISEKTIGFPQYSFFLGNADLKIAVVIDHNYMLIDDKDDEMAVERAKIAAYHAGMVLVILEPKDGKLHKLAEELAPPPLKRGRPALPDCKRKRKAAKQDRKRKAAPADAAAPACAPPSNILVEAATAAVEAATPAVEAAAPAVEAATAAVEAAAAAEAATPAVEAAAAAVEAAAVDVDFLDTLDADGALLSIEDTDTLTNLDDTLHFLKELDRKKATAAGRVTPTLHPRSFNSVFTPEKSPSETQCPGNGNSLRARAFGGGNII
jgi:hypothetical protein